MALEFHRDSQSTGVIDGLYYTTSAGKPVETLAKHIIIALQMHICFGCSHELVLIVSGMVFTSLLVYGFD